MKIKLPGLKSPQNIEEGERGNCQSFNQIRVYRSVFLLEKSNIRNAHCRDCGTELRPGLGIYRSVYRRSGFICFACFGQGLTILTSVLGRKGIVDAGFRIDPLFQNLRACTFDRPQYTTLQIIEAVYKALLDEAYTSIDILLGPAGPGIIEIGDIADSIVI